MWTARHSQQLFGVTALTAGEMSKIFIRPFSPIFA